MVGVGSDDNRDGGRNFLAMDSARAKRKQKAGAKSREKKGSGRFHKGQSWVLS
jgi:hypothetical protein